MVDNKAVRELGPKLVYALHAENSIPLTQMKHEYAPHLTGSMGLAFSIKANIRGGLFGKPAQELCRAYGIPIDQDLLKHASILGSAHPLARYI